jgi:hypothetical protein
MAWMEAGGSGIRWQGGRARDDVGLAGVHIVSFTCFYQVQAATKKASHYIVSFTATSHPRRKHVGQVSSGWYSAPGRHKLTTRMKLGHGGGLVDAALYSPTTRTDSLQVARPYLLLTANPQQVSWQGARPLVSLCRHSVSHKPPPRLPTLHTDTSAPVFRRSSSQYP